MSELRARFRTEMILCGFSANTIDVYIRAIKQLSEFHNKNPLLLTDDQIRAYLLHLRQKRISIPTYNLAVAAIVKFYQLCAPKRVLPRLKQIMVPLVLPEVLSMEEVKRLLDAVISLKYKAILSLMFSAGLRIGECTRIQPRDIDSDRKLVHIRQAKGNKDRYAVIGDELIPLLRQYYVAYKPTTWLFEGAQKGQPLHVRSIQHVFRRAVKAAGITKKIRPHTLRHSFATNLFEQKCPLPAIQTFMGHKYLKSTLIYTHITPRSLADVVNPFDALMSKDEKAQKPCNEKQQKPTDGQKQEPSDGKEQKHD
jgi:integrase/recombinase XerD